MTTIRIMAQPATILALGFLALLAGVVGQAASRRYARPGPLIAAALFSVGAIGILTLLPMSGEYWQLGDQRNTWTGHAEGASCAARLLIMKYAELPLNITGLFNVLLFIPAAFFGTLLFRRPGRVLVALVLLSAGIEIMQAQLAVRLCDSSDLVANAIGALAGCLLASFLFAVTGYKPFRPARPLITTPPKR